MPILQLGEMYIMNPSNFGYVTFLENIAGLVLDVKMKLQRRKSPIRVIKSFPKKGTVLQKTRFSGSRFRI
nr:hypothetical protein [Mycoplasma haemocanis]